jgi:hypothetical protein
MIDLRGMSLERTPRISLERTKDIGVRRGVCFMAGNTTNRRTVSVVGARKTRPYAVCVDKILEAVRSTHRIDEHDLHVTVSVGTATYPDDGTIPDVAISRPDSRFLACLDGHSPHDELISSGVRVRETGSLTAQTARHDRKFRR